MQVTVSYPSASGSDYSNRSTVSTPKGKPVGVIMEVDQVKPASLEDVYERWKEYGFIDSLHLEMLFTLASGVDNPVPYEPTAKATLKRGEYVLSSDAVRAINA